MDGGDHHDKTILNHIMLRFRPIAPKPVMNGSDSSTSDLGNKEVICEKRTKRKYVRVNKNIKKNSVETSKKKCYELSDLRVVESWVTLECVTGGFGHGRRLGCTDVEKLRSLERDTCPGFVSDGDGAVRWVNLAYRRMVWPGEEEGDAVVWLIQKERIPVGLEAFSCRVRVVYGGVGSGSGNVVPCDVWRMDGELGLYAWRLDLEAALSLGR